MDSEIIQYFPTRIASALAQANGGDIWEIRLRTGRPAAVVHSKGISYLLPSGEISPDYAKAIEVAADDIRRVFDSVCQYSIHSHTAQIANCFITVAGGHRAGICGTAVNNGGRLETVRDISGINFRIARQCIGAADKIMREVMKSKPRSVLICGEPASGKTTVLRDLCRQLGMKYSVSLIDERCEIAACVRGRPRNDVGINTDVFSGFSKPDGINAALRVMSPRVIVCDEIGTNGDIAAIESAFGCGVRIAATVHGGSPEDIFRRKNIRTLVEMGVFEYSAFIKNCAVEKIINIGEYYEKHRLDTDNNYVCNDRGGNG
ncbi:MAG: ATPase, T2SS/T4P/T4SS family [Oscillospiraceae bacterium]